MAAVIDISVALRPEMPVWPGSAPLRIERTMDMARGDVANVSRLELDVHTGTHIDAPLHFLRDGAPVDSLDLTDLIGPALVADLRSVAFVDRAALERAAIPAGVRRLLLRTTNSDLWASAVTEFRENYVALTADAAEWVVERGIRVIGVDYLSVQRFGDDSRTHDILLRARVIIIEGLDLSSASPGAYELVCLPLRVAGAEGAPARAVLRDQRTAP